MTVLVLVEADDLKAVLRVVPAWVPEGAVGDDKWTEESIAAKQRLLEAIDQVEARERLLDALELS